MWSKLKKISTNEQGVPLYVPSCWKKGKSKKKPGGVEVFNFDADDLLEQDSVARFATTSADGRRHYRQTEDIAPPKPTPRNSNIETESPNGFDPEPLMPNFVDLLEREVRAENAAKPRARRYVSSVSTFLIIGVRIILY
jgi:hypothetical protein